MMERRRYRMVVVWIALGALIAAAPLLAADAAGPHEGLDRMANAIKPSWDTIRSSTAMVFMAARAD